jgi:PAS domain S-box-containing protein
MLNLLIIEDIEADFLLIDRHLRLNGLAARCIRAANDEELDAALDRGGWNAVLSDYRVPGMEFRQTLATILARLPDVPVILVSGSVGEEAAVDLLKRGLSDFILKGRLARLVPAIERSLKEAGDRRARRAAEQALRESEMLTRSIMDSLRSAIIVLDGQGRIIRVNEAWQESARCNGADEATIRGVGLNYLDACRSSVPDEFARCARAGIERVLGGDEPFFGFEYPCHSPTQQRWFEMHVSPLLGPDHGVVVSHFDITARKLAELALRESEATLERAQAMAHVGSWMADITAGTILASDEGARLLGWTPGVHVMEELAAVVHPEDRGLMREAWEGALRTGAYDIELRIVLDATVRWLHAKGEVHYDEQGRPVKAIGMSQDITEAREAQRALEAHQVRLEELVALRTVEVREAEARVRLVLDSTGDGVYGVDTAGHITFVNPAACAMLGYSAEQLMGQSAHALLHSKRPDGTPYPARECPMHHTLRTGRAVQVDDELFWRADGRPIPIIYAARPMVREDKIVGAVVSFLDLTQRRQAEEATRLALAEAKRLAAVRSEFLANMSHEIRTPLNAVLGLAQVGVRDSAGRRARHTFHRILDSGQLLLGIVNDILDFSKIEAGKLELECVPFDLGAAIDRAVHVCAAAAFDKGLEFTVDEAADLPQRCQGDALRLSQVLVNLLSNAVKFTVRGRVALAAGREGGELVLQVSDSGIGMSDDQMERLFQPFEQADGSTTRRFGGTGLGLAICKRLVAMMGGSIGVRSRLGEGACFSVRLPLAGAGAPVSGSGERIVLAGMPAAEVDGVRRSLEALGAQVVMTTPEEALSAEASLVALDARALGKEQLDRAGRRAALGQRLALVSTPGLSESVPMSLREQVQLIERPLRARQLLSACRAAMPGQEAPALGSRLAGVRVLAAEDNEVNRLVLEEILEREGAQLSLARDGHQALTRLEREGASSFDIVLTDIQMPGIDGYETARRVRAVAPDLPVIGLTAHAMAEERARCLTAGMVDHIAKPVDIDVLVAAILRHCREPGWDKAAAATTPAAVDTRAGAHTPAATVLIDSAALSRRYRNKQAFIDRLLATAAETHAKTPVRLRQAIVEQDLDALAFVAHKLKGTAGNLAAARLHALAASTEEAARAGRADAWQLAGELAAAVDALLDELGRRDAASVNE